MEGTDNGAIPHANVPRADDVASGVDFSADAELAAFFYLIVTCSQATSVHDETGALVLFNPSCTSLLGYERGELSVMEAPNVVHSADAEALGAVTEAARTSPDGRASTRLRLVHKSGDAIDVDLDVSTAEVADRRFLVIVSTPTNRDDTVDRSASWAHAFG